VYVKGELRAVVVGQTTAQVEIEYGVTNHIEVIAIDTADNESSRRTITVIS
jgi:molybdopterin-binding protein